MARNKKRARSNEMLAKEIVDKFTHSRSWRMPYKEKWDRFYKMYRSDLSETNYPWQSNVWVPYSFSTIETLAPRMVANKPQIDIMPREAGDEDFARVMANLVDYQWEEMGMEEIVPDIVKSMLIYGTAIIKSSWLSERETKTSDVVVDEEFIDLGTVEEDIEVLTDRPNAELVDLYDFFWDPRAVDIETARWVAHRLYRTQEHLLELQKQGIYKNVKLIEEMNADLDDDKSSRRGTSGVSIPQELERDGKQHVELIEYWTRDRVITIANRSVIVRDDPNPYRHGEIPFIRVVDQSMPHEFLGIGELEPIETLQYELNMKRNQRNDNVTLALNKMFIVRNGAGIDENELISDAGGVVHTDDMNAIKEMQMSDVTSSSYNEETLIKGDIQQTTGVSDFTRGIGSESLGNETATGISLIQEAGNARFRLKIRNLESGIKKLGRFMVSMNQQFISDEKVIRILGDEGYEWMQVKPNDLRGDFDVIVQTGSTLPSNEAVERKQIMELFQIFAGDPEVNQSELKRRVLETFGVKNVDKLLAGGGVQAFGTPQDSLQPEAVPTTGELDQQSMLQSALAQPQA